jgi:predicted Zn-dependent protease
MSRRGSAVLAEEELIDLNIELQANPKSENAKKAKSVLINHKAIEAAGKNKLDDALKYVEEAIELDPSNRTLQLNKAEYLARKNKFNDAIEICAKLVETNAEDYAARHQLIAYLNNAFEGDMECGTNYFLIFFD